MAELSSAAQVIDIAIYGPGLGATRRQIAAAALRAAADQVVPAEVRVRKGMRPGGVGSTTPAEWMQDQQLHTRRHFLAIAAELDGTN